MIRNITNDIRFIKCNRLKGKSQALTLFSYKWWKNILDKVFALILIVTLSPFLLIITVLLRLDSKGSPVFCREQVGKNENFFKMYKFRTMYINNDDSEYKSYLRTYVLENAPYTKDQNGKNIYKVINDPRVTKFGAFLRKTNLDELPQLLNVLKGEMSFIGPRPDIPFAVKMYKDWQYERLSVKPGITGLWQVYKRQELSFEDMVRLDIDYIKRESLFLDIKIVIKTVSVILGNNGSL
jgi:lipopolysaccharide/colanic/teichoic acid biosynthesis glycosyltransferase